MQNRGRRGIFWVTAACLAVAMVSSGFRIERAAACTTCVPYGFCEVCTDPYEMLHSNFNWNKITALGEDPEGLMKFTLVNVDSNTTKLTLSTSHGNNSVQLAVLCFTGDPNGVRRSEDRTVAAAVMINDANEPVLIAANGGVADGSFRYFSPEGLNEWSWDDANSVLTRGIESVFQTTTTANYDYTPGDEEHVTFREVKRGATTISKTFFKYTLDASGKLVRLRKTVQPYNLSWMYVYYDSSCGDADKVGKLRLTVGPAGVARYLAAAGFGNGVDANDPGGPCGLDDRLLTPDAALVAYAEREYTGYDEEGRITSMIGGGCGSCGTAGEGSYSFVYGTNDHYDANTMEARENCWKKYRGTQMPGGQRMVEFVNADDQVIYSVVQAMDGNTVENVWITHYVYYSDHDYRIGKIWKKRMPSACAGAGYTYTEIGGWVTNVVPKETGTLGQEDLLDYDPNSGKVMTEKSRQGTDGNQPAYWRRRSAYEPHTATLDGVEITVHHLAAERIYPEQTEDENDPNALDTIYDYEYYPGTNAVMVKTVTYPAVTGARNGSDANTSVAYHYFRDANSSVNLYYNDWTRHEEGRYSYTERGTDLWNHGLIVKSIEDANGTPPGAWTAKTDGLNLTTTREYYSEPTTYGRPKSITPPSGRRSMFAYVHQEVQQDSNTTPIRFVTLATSLMDGNGHYDYAPVQITVTDLDGRTVIAARGYPSTGQDGNMVNDWTALQQELASAFNGTIVSKAVNNYDNKGRLTHSDSYYDLSGDGKFLRTAFFHNDAGRQYMTEDPDGTRTWMAVDGLNRPIATYRGTGDTAADEDGPGTLKLVSTVEYDGGGVGDGLVTRERQFFKDSGDPNSYAKDYLYDWRGRLIAARGSDKVVTRYQRDNLGRTTMSLIFADSGTENFQADAGEPYLSASTTEYDQLGRAWRSRQYKIGADGAFDPNALATTIRLTSLSWYSERGLLIKTANPNGLFNKRAYDGVGRLTATYICFDEDESEYGDANDVIGDTVIEQTKHSYNEKGLEYLTRDYRRLDSTTGEGELNEFFGSAPKALVHYTGHWFDELGREVTRAYYGNNGNTAYTGGAAPDPNTSDNHIVSKKGFDTNTGYPVSTWDNKNRETRRQYDALGRTLAVIENYVDGDPTNGTADQDRTTQYAYDWRGRMGRITAKAQNDANDQKTYYFFWDTVTADGNQNLPSGSLVTAVAYPDTVDSIDDDLGEAMPVCTLTETTSHDRVTYTYDLLARKATHKDQRGVLHEYWFSTATGRLMFDDADGNTSLPGGVDNAVVKIGYEYDAFGRTESVKSYDANNLPVNEVAMEYGPEGWGAVTRSTQGHDGNELHVDYFYADGNSSYEARYVRLTGVKYPGPSTRRMVYYNYPDSGIGAMLSRLDNIASTDDEPEAGDKYVAYGYFGASTLLKVEYPAVTNGLRLSYAGPGEYTPLDRFGRVLWQRWTRTNGSVVDRYFYGYDRTGNRTWRAERANAASAGGRDEAYVYDGLDRLAGAKRGILPDKPYQAPYPGDADRNGLKDDFITVKRNLGGSPRVWGTGDFGGDGYCDAGDLSIAGSGPSDPSENVVRWWSWALDPLGNWSQFVWDDDGSGQGEVVTQTRSHNKANEVTGISGGDWVEPAYDTAGNMTRGPQPGYESVDANAQWYVYDAWNRLATVCQGQSSPGGLVARYTYNGLDWRIRKEVNSGPKYDYYHNLGWQLLEVRKDGNSNPLKQFIWGTEYVDAPVVRFRDADTDGALDDTLYYTHDAQFNTTALVDSNSAVVERYLYDPYGKPTVLNGAPAAEKDPNVAEWSPDADNTSDWDNEFQYGGYCLDTESWLFLARHRYLTWPLGRWTSADPIVYGDGLNRHQYAASNPILFRDPAGLEVSVAGQIDLGVELLKKIGENDDKTWKTQGVDLPSSSLSIHKFDGNPAGGPVAQSLDGPITADWTSKEGWTGVIGNTTWYRLNARPAGKMCFTTSKTGQKATCVKGTITIQIKDFHLWSTDPDGEYGRRDFKHFENGKPVVLDGSKNWQFRSTWWKPFDKVTITLTGEIDTCGERDDLLELDSGSWDFTPKEIRLRQATVSPRKTKPGLFGDEEYWKVNAQDVGIVFDQSNLKATVYCKKGGED